MLVCFFLGRLSLSNAVASVLGFHCNLRGYVSSVVGIVVSIFNCRQSANLLQELFDPNESGCVSA